MNECEQEGQPVCWHLHCSPLAPGSLVQVGQHQRLLLRGLYRAEYLLRAWAACRLPGAQQSASARTAELTCPGAGRFIAEFHADMAALNCRPPDLEPRATDHVADMVAAIQRIVAHGHGYEAGDDMLFAVDSLEGYGRLSGRSLVLPQVTCWGARALHVRQRGEEEMIACVLIR